MDMDGSVSGRPKFCKSLAKPAGGYCLVRVRSVLAMWQAMNAGDVTLYDFRVWLAAHEMMARRCCMKRGRTAAYNAAEIVGFLASGSEAKVRQAIGRLQRAGLMEWKVEKVSLSTVRRENELADMDEWEYLLSSVQNNRRKVPIPRRLIRYLVKSRNRTLIATALGHLLRCLYLRGGRCVSGGRCKASWVADVFGLDVRNVKCARKELMAAGWLIALKARQVSLNRWGLPLLVNLLWAGTGSPRLTKAPPLERARSPKTPPPDNHIELSARSINQKLGRASGVQGKESGEHRPNLKHVRLEDLKNPSQLDVLYRQAKADGVVSGSPAARLQWFAAAEHAMAVASSNPCGLFVSLCRRRLWEHITQQEEDTACGKLKMLDYGEGSGSVRTETETCLQGTKDKEKGFLETTDKSAVFGRRRRGSHREAVRPEAPMRRLEAAAQNSLCCRIVPEPEGLNPVRGVMSGYSVPVAGRWAGRV
jgi:hypothetical protein